MSIFSEGRAGLYKVEVIHPLALSPLMGLGMGDRAVSLMGTQLLVPCSFKVRNSASCKL